MEEASTEAPPAERPAVWPVFAVYGAVFVGLQCLGIALLAAWLAVAPRQGGDLQEQIRQLASSRAALLLGGSVSAIVFTATALMAGAMAREGSARRLRLRAGRAGFVRTALMVVGLLAVGQAADSAVALAGWGGKGALGMMARAMEGAGAGSLVLALLVLGLLAGTAEELFFRGFMQTRLRQRLGPWPAIGITALAFGLMHFDPLHTPLALLLGLFLGWITELSGSIVPAMVVHVVNNAVWVVMVGLLPMAWPRQWHLTVLLATVSVAVAVVVGLAVLYPGGVRGEPSGPAFRSLPQDPHAQGAG